ncbi:MAG: Gfo/Idh/MocA family oxidoreductase [Albidovulum sp.]|nr:Gfo/Idh/MocA family oxidoreductase [Albidovulum sp.]MDE0303465.1 Gfo/Idh/MocA family oxidoreductase [Albidovulum sp.]
MGTKEIGVAVIGTGRISDLHAAEYMRNPNCRIVALCDADANRAAERARAWGVKGAAISTDFREVLDRGDVDLVEILLPHHLHLQAALEAMNAGKAVSLQKPMCLSESEADKLVEAAEMHTRPFKVFENFLFHPPVMRANELVEEGAIGEIVSIRIKSNPGISRTSWKIPESANQWRQDRSRSGGGPLVFDDGHHKFALAWSFMGMPSKVHAFVERTRTRSGYLLDAPGIISFLFPGPKVGSFEIAYSPELEIDTQYYAQDDRVEITGTSGVLWINCGHGRLGDPPPLAMYRNGNTTEYRDMISTWEQSFLLSTRHFIDVLMNGGRPVLTAREGRQVLRMALAAEESARTGSSVPLQ